MAKYYPVWPKYWRGSRRKWDDRHKLLGLYLLTCEHRNLEGLYYLPAAYIAADIGWSQQTAERTLAGLVTEGFCQYDADAEVVFVPKALAYQAPKTDNQITGALRSLEAVPSSCLWQAFVNACESHATRLLHAIREQTEWHADPMPDPLPSGPDGFSHARADVSNSSSNSSSSSSSTVSNASGGTDLAAGADSPLGEVRVFPGKGKAA
jgi:hypothetical protein